MGLVLEELNKRALKVLKPLTEMITNFYDKCLKCFENLETLSRRLFYSKKQPFSDVVQNRCSQYSQEKTCVGVSF